MTTQTSISNKFTNNDLNISRASVGGNVIVNVKNTDNTNAASNSYIIVESGGASGGDALVSFNNNVINTTMGIDNSDADAFVISRDASLGTSNSARCDINGAWTYPLNPCFSVNLNGVNKANISGAGASYTIPFDTEVYDIGNNFNTGTYTFTAPLDGIYLFCLANVSNDCAAETVSNSGIAVNGTLVLDSVQAKGATSADACGKVSGLLKLTAGDAVTAVISISGEASNRCDLLGAATDTHFQGALVG